MKYLAIVAITALLTASTIYQLRNVPADLTEYFAAYLGSAGENDPGATESGETKIETACIDQGSLEVGLQQRKISREQTHNAGQIEKISVQQMD